MRYADTWNTRREYVEEAGADYAAVRNDIANNGRIASS